MESYLQTNLQINGNGGGCSVEFDQNEARGERAFSLAPDSIIAHVKPFMNGGGLNNQQC